MKVIITAETGDHTIKCQFCNKTIALLIDDNMNPSAEQCCKAGNVPIPNFGWFCSQSCATKYEHDFKIDFMRNPVGEIGYYADTTNFENEEKQNKGV